MLVTDMILEHHALRVPVDLAAVDLVPQEQRDRIVRFVAAEHAEFAQYFEVPPPMTTVCAVQRGGQLVGVALSEAASWAPDRPQPPDLTRKLRTFSASAHVLHVSRRHCPRLDQESTPKRPQKP